MGQKRIMIVEMAVGLSLLLIGFTVYWWAQQLVWILIYPPPVEKQILDVAPYLISLIGVVIVLDSIRRLIKHH